MSKNDETAQNGSAPTNVTELRPGQKEKVKEPRPPAEAPRTWPAPEVERIAEKLIQGKRMHMSVLRQARIDYVFSNAEREGDLNVAHAQRYSPTYGYLYEDRSVPQFILRVSKPQWDRIPDELKEQAVFHYLLRFGSDSAGRWRIEKPDVVGFAAELEEFKGQSRWNEGFVRARQMGLFDGIAAAELVESR